MRQRGGGESRAQGKGKEWNRESQRIRILKKIVPLCNLLLLMLQKAFLKGGGKGRREGERERGREGERESKGVFLPPHVASPPGLAR